LAKEIFVDMLEPWKIETTIVCGEVKIPPDTASIRKEWDFALFPWRESGISNLKNRLACP
jgi:hypothetical protein